MPRVTKRRGGISAGVATVAGAAAVVLVMVLGGGSAAVAGPARVLPAAPAPALAAPALMTAQARSSATGLTTTLVSFTPLTDTAGERVEFAALGCGPGQPFSATYTEQRGGAQLIHRYAGAATACHFLPTLTSGSLVVAWSRALRVKLELTATAQAKLTRVKISRGCYGTTSVAQYLATGEVHAAIHARQLGAFIRTRTRLRARLERFVLPGCALNAGGSGSFSSTLSFSTPGGSGSLSELLHGHQLQALWGANESIDALQARGTPTTLSFAEPADDGPIPTVTDTFGLNLTGGGAFTSTANLQRATLNFASPLSTGQLTFTAGIGCPPTIRASDGTFSGRATVEDPVLGRVLIDGTLMSEGQLSVVAAAGQKCAPVNLGEQ